MDISYEIVSPKEQEANVVQMGGGCYTKCEVNTDYGADYWCCERIKSAQLNGNRIIVQHNDSVKSDKV